MSITQLPKGITQADTKRDWDKRLASYEGIYSLTFYKVIGRANEWMIGTLFIRNPSRRQRANGIDCERTYAIGVTSERIFTIGCGKHVAESVTVYLTEDNLERLKPMVDLYIKGLRAANACRDHRSTSIARTRQYRALAGW
jgi:hypothetical protein